MKLRSRQQTVAAAAGWHGWDARGSSTPAACCSQPGLQVGWQRCFCSSHSWWLPNTADSVILELAISGHCWTAGRREAESRVRAPCQRRKLQQLDQPPCRAHTATPSNPPWNARHSLRDTESIRCSCWWRRRCSSQLLLHAAGGFEGKGEGRCDHLKIITLSQADTSSTRQSKGRPVSGKGASVAAYLLNCTDLGAGLCTQH